MQGHLAALPDESDLAPAAHRVDQEAYARRVTPSSPMALSGPTPPVSARNLGYGVRVARINDRLRAEFEGEGSPVGMAFQREDARAARNDAC